MNKKNKLRAGLDSVFSTPTQTEEVLLNKSIDTAELIKSTQHVFRRGRPQKHAADRPAAERGCKSGEARYTVLMKKEQAEALKDIAYWQRQQLKEVIAEAAAQYIANYEKKNGTVKARNK
jgi:hypothetical protein